MKCSIDLIEAAAAERLDDDRLETLRKHLVTCQRCRSRLDQTTAGEQWWQDVSRFLDESVLCDPEADSADSSTGDARLFDDDDPVGELRAIGAIDPTSHPEMLGMLGRYTIEREIGSGGMGVVLKAHDAELSRTVAIKVLAPHLARSGAAKQRFIREGRAAAAVVHENVVAIHEVDSSGKLPSLVMRYVDGISLQRHVDLYGPLSVHDALRIGAQTAAGLAAAHRQGIIHRDVKPANILVNHSCNRAWISDFGLARAVDDASLTRTGFIAGTPHYMSPEQARGSDVGPASDLFSLGAVLYFMFAARPPWRAERSLAVLHRIVQHPHRPLWQINADIPRQVSDLVDRLLQKRVSDRPQSASDVGQELEKALSQLQNPGARQSGETAPVIIKPRWWTRPWFVAPVAAGLTAVAFMVNDDSRATSARVEPMPSVPSLSDEYGKGMRTAAEFSPPASRLRLPGSTTSNATQGASRSATVPRATTNIPLDAPELPSTRSWESAPAPLFGPANSPPVVMGPENRPDGFVVESGPVPDWKPDSNADQSFTLPSNSPPTQPNLQLPSLDAPKEPIASMQPFPDQESPILESPILESPISESPISESPISESPIPGSLTSTAETWVELYELERLVDEVESLFATGVIRVTDDTEPSDWFEPSKH